MMCTFFVTVSLDICILKTLILLVHSQLRLSSRSGTQLNNAIELSLYASAW